MPHDTDSSKYEFPTLENLATPLVRNPNVHKQPEKTGIQIVTLVGQYFGVDKVPDTSKSGWYKKVREMRKDATIALVRQLVVAPVLSSKWTVETDGKQYDEAAELIKENLIPMRAHIVKQSFWGCVDFGWMPFEKILGFTKSFDVVLAKLKPLIHEHTEILINGHNGKFLGLENDNVVLKLNQSFLAYWDVEGTDWRGHGYMEKAEQAYDSWNNIQDAADRFDTKMAGSHWVVHYPVGVSVVNGTETDNGDLAKTILNNLTASGSVSVPRTIEQFIMKIEDNTKVPDAWKIELITAKGGTGIFIDRMKYLDTLKVRAFGFPERSILEGQFGTKAEAGAHGDFAIENIQLRMIEIDNLINAHIVNHLLRVNYGSSFLNKVRLVSTPIVSRQLQVFKTIYEKLLTQPQTLLNELDIVDLQAVREKLSIPEKPTGLEGLETTIKDKDEFQQGPGTGVPGSEDISDASQKAKIEQESGLRGTQIKSLIEIVDRVAANSLTEAAAKELILISFPFLTPERVSELLRSFLDKSVQPMIPVSPVI